MSDEVGLQGSIEIAGARLRSLRKERGLTQQQLADRVSAQYPVSRGYLSQIEAEPTFKVRLPVARALATELGIALEDLTLRSSGPVWDRLGTLLEGEHLTPGEHDFLSALLAPQATQLLAAWRGRERIDPGPLLIVITGPSGVGKDSVMAGLLERNPLMVGVRSMTTRAPRLGELDGRDYDFVSREQFRQCQMAGELFEYAEVHGQLYGRSRAAVRNALAEGHDVIIQVDVQGALHFQQALPDSVIIFLVPADRVALEQRLKRRGVYDEALLEARSASLLHEIAMSNHFRNVVVNVDGHLPAAVSAVEAVIQRERSRSDRRPVRI